MKHIFILNPAAGGGKAETVLLPGILSAVKSNGVDYEIHRSLNRNDITSWVSKKAAEGTDVCFYACGGDGTLNDVMSGMVMHKNARLAVIPCGTGNDFVKNFTNKENFLDVDKLMKGREFSIDVINYGTEYSVNMLNIGIDCDVVVEVSRLKDTIKGSMTYVAGAVKVLSKGKKYRMRYTFNGQETVEDDFLLCAVGNGQYCGGGFRSCPTAVLNDGRIDVCIVKPVPFSRLLPLFAKYHRGTHIFDKNASLYVKYVQCESFRLEAAEEVNISKDGECSLFNSAEFKIIPGALRFILPEGSEPIEHIEYTPGLS